MKGAAGAKRGWSGATVLQSAMIHTLTNPSMPTAKNRSLPSGISRIDQTTSRTHGYFVRVGYRKTAKGWRPKASAFFGDASHGGKAAALKAAEKWLKSNRKTVGGGRKMARAS
jgi:hypothetical protein